MSRSENELISYKILSRLLLLNSSFGVGGDLSLVCATPLIGDGSLGGEVHTKRGGDVGEKKSR
jgi:hypothetical protein